MIYFMPFMLRSSNHQCTPLPIDEVSIVERYMHSVDKAGYDIRTSITEMSQCPVCKAKYSYNESVEYKVEFISYEDFHKRNK